MGEIKFRDIKFIQEKDKVKLVFLRIYYSYIDNLELERIGDFKADGGNILFPETDQSALDIKFNELLNDAFSRLTNKITKKPTIYIHKNSGIPLIGNDAFGIVDRGTNIIEIKLNTGCNLDCIYCSVDNSKRDVDFVVEKDYIVEELKKIIEYKDDDNIEIHISTQGEPLLYSPIVELVRDISQIKEVKVFSIDTNATLLSEKLIDDLVDAGMTRFNISINSFDQNLARKLSCKEEYDVERIKKLAKYAAERSYVIIAPVMMRDINENEMQEMIEFAKTISKNHKKPIIGIQNYLEYKFGKKPTKQYSWKEFEFILKKLEDKHGIKLLYDFKVDFNLHPTKELIKPFKKGNITEGAVKCVGRKKNEVIAVSEDRNITVKGDIGKLKDKKVRIKITRSKHNIFYGMIV
ncbi:MAG: radical SAM protein [Candidatus Woesearchaeota archaeon]